MATTSHFYITLFSNTSRDIYEQNIHADFTVKLSQTVDLGSTSSWEVGSVKFRVPHSHGVGLHLPNIE